MALEMKVLYQKDPTLVQVLSKSAFSAVYEFQEDKNVKLEIEGCLYLLKSSTQPFYKMLLLNRKSILDFVDFLTDKTEFVEKDNFVAYSSSTGIG